MGCYETYYGMDYVQDYKHILLSTWGQPLRRPGRTGPSDSRWDPFTFPDWRNTGLSACPSARAADYRVLESHILGTFRQEKNLCEEHENILIRKVSSHSKV